MQLVEIHPLHVSERRVLSAGPHYRTDFYFTFRKPDPADDFELGVTEQGLLFAVADWHLADAEREKWREGPLVYELVRAFFVDDHANPDRWALEEVQKNALAYRLCVESSSRLWRGRRKWRISAGRDGSAELRESCQALGELSGRFASLYPELWSTMHTETWRAIDSRITDRTSYEW